MPDLGHKAGCGEAAQNVANGPPSAEQTE
jgi:hypothetical protein